MNPMIFDYFRKLIYEETGIVYNEKNAFALETRLQKIAKKLEFSSVEELYKSCQTAIGNDVLSFILDIATNNETSFFRDMHVFRAVADFVLPSLFEAGQKHFDIWSAACSAGQEVYSLALIMEEFREKHPGITYKILGSDISSEILDKAKSGVYSQLEVQRGLPTPILVKNFERMEAKAGEPTNWKVKYDLRRNIEFRQLNLLKPFPVIGPFDVVFLRNVLIYHDEDGRSDILSRIHSKLKAGAKLFLGSAERVVGLDHLYELGVNKRVVSYKTLKLTKAAS